MKVVVLGKGLAGTVFHVVSNHLLKKEIDIIVYYKESLPMQQRGLRYIHAPSEQDKKESYTVKDNAAANMWKFFSDEFKIKNPFLTKQLNWAVMNPGGKIQPAECIIDSKDEQNITTEYALLNYRQYESNIMNGLLKGNRHPKASCVSYLEIIKKLEDMSKLFASNNHDCAFGTITSVNLEKKQIYVVDTLGDGCWIDYDVLINTLPLPVFVNLLTNMNVNNDFFKYSSSLYVTSHTIVNTGLDYYYNIWPGAYDNLQLSRVTFKLDRTDFEFSINPKNNNSLNRINIASVASNIIFQHLKVLSNMFEVDVSWNNFSQPIINKYSHFDESFDIDDFIISDLNCKDVIMLGRYAQWNHEVKLGDIWKSCVQICKELNNYEFNKG